MIRAFIMASAIGIIVNPQIVRGSDNSTEGLNKRLFSAVLNNNFALVRSTLTAGADPKSTNAEGLTAAGLAVEKSYFNIAHYILGILKQKSSAKKGNTLAILEELNKINTAILKPGPISKQIQVSKSIPTPTPPTAKETKNYEQWPINVPNPFSPYNQYNKSMPIIGAIQKSSVKPATQRQVINPKIKARALNDVPIKTPNISMLPAIQLPKPIPPLGKKSSEEILLKKSSSLKLEKKKVHVITDFEVEDFDEEDLFDKVWNKVNQIF